MRVSAQLAVFGCIAAAIIRAQTPTFDAASVKVVDLSSHPVFGKSGGPGTSDPGRIHLCCVGMFSLLMRAYDVELDQISGPGWIMDNLGPTLYQVDATMLASTTKEEFQFMMRNLLVERFHLQVHEEKRNFPGYELVPAEGGPKLRPSKPAGGDTPPETSGMPRRIADGTLVLPPGPQMFTSLGRGMVIVQAQEKSMADLVKGMGRLLAQSLGEDPNDFSSRKARVVDKTGLTGKYDFPLEFSCDACHFASASSDPPGALPSLFVALEKQLGLKLVKTKDIPLNVLVVDHVDKTPTAN